MSIAAHTGYVEAVIGAMAGHVGLASIADAIMARYGADRFGDFRVRPRRKAALLMV